MYFAAVAGQNFGLCIEIKNIGNKLIKLFLGDYWISIQNPKQKTTVDNIMILTSDSSKTQTFPRVFGIQKIKN